MRLPLCPLALGLGLVFAFGGCASVSVETDLAPDADFTAYATYELVFGVVPGEQTAGDATTAGVDVPPIDATKGGAEDGGPEATRVVVDEPAKENPRVREAIESALRDKGYRAADTSRADLVVGYTIRGEEVVRLVDAGDPDTNFEQPRRYARNTLVVTASDGESGALLWKGRGATESATSGALVNEDPEKRLLEAVRHVMAAFPGARAEDA
jgi:hypothetical protein